MYIEKCIYIIYYLISILHWDTHPQDRGLFGFISNMITINQVLNTFNVSQ